MNNIDDNRAALAVKLTSKPAAAATTTKKAKAPPHPSPEDVHRQQERRQNLYQLKKMAEAPRDYQNYDAAFAVFTQKELDFQQEEAFAAEEKAEAAAAAATGTANPFSFASADRRARARRAAKERMLQLQAQYFAPPPSPPTRRRRRASPATPVKTLEPGAAAEAVYSTKRFKAERAALREKKA